MIGFLQGPGGENSSIRLIAFFFSFTVGSIWAWCSVKSNQLVSIPGEVIDLVVYLTGAKVLQSAIVENGAAKKISGWISTRFQQKNT